MALRRRASTSCWPVRWASRRLMSRSRPWISPWALTIRRLSASMSRRFLARVSSMASSSERREVSRCRASAALARSSLSCFWVCWRVRSLWGRVWSSRFCADAGAARRAKATRPRPIVRALTSASPWRGKTRASQGPREAATGGVRSCTLRIAADRERREATCIGAPSRGPLAFGHQPTQGSQETAPAHKDSDLGRSKERGPGQPQREGQERLQRRQRQAICPVEPPHRHRSAHEALDQALEEERQADHHLGGPPQPHDLHFLPPPRGHHPAPRPRRRCPPPPPSVLWRTPPPGPAGGSSRRYTTTRKRSRHWTRARPRFSESTQKAPRAVKDSVIRSTALTATRPPRRRSRSASPTRKKSIALRPRPSRAGRRRARGCAA